MFIIACKRLPQADYFVFTFFFSPIKHLLAGTFCNHWSFLPPVASTSARRLGKKFEGSKLALFTTEFQKQ
jgi:hypothetical protein